MHSKNGFQTRVWGPAAWLFLHCITLNYDPKRNKKETKAFFDHLAFVLPCGACRENYKHTIRNSNTLQLNDTVFESRESLAFWLFRLHNYVTRCQTGKRSWYNDTKHDFYQMVQFYENFRAKCVTHKDTSKHKGGCVLPVKNGGIRLRTVIKIKPWSGSQDNKKSITMCSTV